MADQASQLREMAGVHLDFFSRVSNARVLAVTSGKGGVGKTNLAVNLSIALSRNGGKVAILDADFGLANIDVLLGLTPRFHLAHLLYGDATLDDIVLQGPGGVLIVPASSGLERMVNMSDWEKELLWTKLYPLLSRVDWLIVDTAAGISNMVTDFLVKAHEVILVCSDEPTSLVDAYALVKVLESKSAGKTIQMVVNNVDSDAEGREIHRQLSRVVQNFLKREIDYLGWVASDTDVPEAVRRQQALMEWSPGSDAAKSYMRLARKLHLHFERTGSPAAGTRPAGR